MENEEVLRMLERSIYNEKAKLDQFYDSRGDIISTPDAFDVLDNLERLTELYLKLAAGNKYSGKIQIE